MALQPVIVVLVHTDDGHPKPSLCHRRRLESWPAGLTIAALGLLGFSLSVSGRAVQGALGPARRVRGEQDSLFIQSGEFQFLNWQISLYFH